MTARRDWLCEFWEAGSTTILLGDHHSVVSQGIGLIRLHTHGGTIKILENVKYVLNLRRNLISTGTLDKNSNLKGSSSKTALAQQTRTHENTQSKSINRERIY